jgi:hypothetical protein
LADTQQARKTVGYRGVCAANIPRQFSRRTVPGGWSREERRIAGRSAW